MPPVTVAESTLPVDWTEVLHTVERALEQAVADALRREQELPVTSLPPNLEADAAPVWQEGRQRLTERFAGHDAVARQAEQCVAEVDALLQAEETALRQWLAVVQTNRQRLAELPLREVSCEDCRLQIGD